MTIDVMEHKQEHGTCPREIFPFEKRICIRTSGISMIVSNWMLIRERGSEVIIEMNHQ
jgi:hypothetical protein